MTMDNEATKATTSGAADVGEDVEPFRYIHVIDATFDERADINNLPLMCGVKELDVSPPAGLWAQDAPLAEIVLHNGHYDTGDLVSIEDVVEQMCPRCIIGLIERRAAKGVG